MQFPLVQKFLNDAIFIPSASISYFFSDFSYISLASSLKYAMLMTTFRYQVEPLGFLIKDDPNYTLQILHCLQSVLEKSKIPASPNGRLHFRMPDQDLFIPIHEILYIEATGAHRITVHTTTAIYQCSGSLNETLSKLDQSFFLCHKSCLVNTAHIRTLYRRPCQIVLDNGAVCPCAQRRFSQLQHLMGIE